MPGSFQGVPVASVMNPNPLMVGGAVNQLPVVRRSEP